MADGEVLLRGTWLYGGTVPTEVLVQAGSRPFPSPEDEPDSSAARQDLNPRYYFVVWSDPGNPARIASEVGSFATLREARAHAESAAGSPIHWRDDPPPDMKLGIALETLHLSPLHGLRHTPEAGTCGWYIWAGEEPSAREDFFKPLHVAHLSDRCPEALPFLALAPGSRFLVAGSHEEVWVDPDLILASGAT